MMHAANLQATLQILGRVEPHHRILNEHCVERGKYHIVQVATGTYHNAVEKVSERVCSNLKI